LQLILVNAGRPRFAQLETVDNESPALVFALAFLYLNVQFSETLSSRVTEGLDAAATPLTLPLT
jgi:hypothetical protein